MPRKPTTPLDRAEIRAAFLRAVLTLDPTEGGRSTRWAAPRSDEGESSGDEPPPQGEDHETRTS